MTSVLSKSTAVYNILIIDDIPENLNVLGEILRKEGYKVRPVTNGNMALQVARKEKPNLILMDIMMPEIDGFETCRLFKEDENLIEIPIIFISALNDAKDIVKALQAGGVDYITKPFQVEEVKARVALHLRLEQQKLDLLKLNSDKDRLMSILAHDLKSPFTTILGFSEMLKTNVRKYDIEKIERQANLIYNSALDFYNFLNELLMWVRTQSGKMYFDPQILIAHDICNKVLSVLKINAHAKAITFNTIIDNDLTVFADIDMLKTILRNLVSNAIKFTNQNGSIEICVKQLNQEILFSVSDNGVGIPENIIAKILDNLQFYTTLGTAYEKGTGLGLQLCKEFVLKHKGKLWVESKVGKGSTFYFTIPV